MFKAHCSRCNNKVGKKFDFCPYCGNSMKSREEDSGFFGKNDIQDFDMKLPFGFNMVLKPLMKELNKQMTELDKEVKKDQIKTNTKSFTSFMIRIDAPGQKPIRINKVINGANGLSQIKSFDDRKVINEKRISLPNIAKNILEKSKNLPRKEPEISVRRLSDKIIYELNLPGVNDLRKVNMMNLGNSLEVKAVSDKEVFIKNINISSPLTNYYLDEDILILEFAAG